MEVFSFVFAIIPNWLLAPILIIVAVLLALGAYKLVKEFFPW